MPKPETRPRWSELIMGSPSRYTLFPLIWPVVCGLSFVILAMASLHARPLFPGTELRDLGIAWGMWREGMFLVPRINGMPFAHEPPLLYWIITAGWSLFGVNDVWPRLISPLFGFSGVLMCAALARQLWPGMAKAGGTPGLGIGGVCGAVLMGGLFWPVLSTVWGSLPIAVFFLIVAFWGVVVSWRSGLWSGCVTGGLALGLGMLASGPVLLVYILPVMAMAPLWGRAMIEPQAEPQAEPPAGRWRGWYGQMLAFLGLAVGVVLLWLIPAILQEDALYRAALVQRLFTPVSLPGSGTGWVYALLLAGLMLPWVLWSKTWYALRGIGYSFRDGGFWFCVLWVLPVLGVGLVWPGGDWSSVWTPVMMAIPGLSLMVGFLLFVWSASTATLPGGGASGGLTAGLVSRLFIYGAPLMGLMIALLGVLVIVMPLASNTFDLPWWVGRLWGGWGVIMVLCGLLIAVIMPRVPTLRVLMVAATSVLIIASGYLAAKPLRSELHNMTAAAHRVSSLLEQGIAVAFIGPYEGEFDFLGRLERPLDILERDDPLGAVAWSATNNPGEVISFYPVLPGGLPPQAVFAWWDRHVVFWSGETLTIRPSLVLSQDQL